MGKNKKRFSKRQARGMLIAGGIFAILLGALVYLANVTLQTASVPFSQFVEMVERGEIEKVFLRDQIIQALPKGQEFGGVETVAPKNFDIWGKLQRHSIALTVVNTSGNTGFWYIILAVILLMLFVGWLVWYFTQQMRGQSGGGGNNIFNMGKSRARLFMPSTIKDKFSSVAGADEAKEELTDLINFLKNPEKYRRLGARITRGVLLIGAPGNGKTLLARAVAGEANCPFFSVSGSDFIEVFVGVGASRVRDLFAQARKHAPCIVFIDEIDAVGRQRGNGMGGGHDEREQTLNQLLTEMDGFQTSASPVIVIAATNRPDVLDHALLRPGRFDKRVTVPYPDLQSREKILNVHAKNVKIDELVDLAKIARGTPGFSGADLANLINEAALIASKTERATVTVEDFEEARDKILLGKEVKSMVQTPEDLKITAYHESGHTLVSLLLPDQCDPLHKVTIVPRGRALGITHSLPEREKYNRAEKELRGMVMQALGGRVAEDIVFGEATTGAYSDFQRASEIARSMVCNYGMSDKLGYVVYGQGQGDFVYSQKTGETIDAEVQKILDAAYEKTKKLLSDNRDKLDTLADKLLEKETVQADEVYDLLGIEPRELHSFAPESNDDASGDQEDGAGDTPESISHGEPDKQGA